MGFAAGDTGTCPHCRVGVRFETMTVRTWGASPVELYWNAQSGHSLVLEAGSCPACGRPILYGKSLVSPNGVAESIDRVLWPEPLSRVVPPIVKRQAPNLALDFHEAVAVFHTSKKASAALSRRCLQYILREKGATRSRDLADQIEEVLPKLPRELAANVDAIRHVGNFAAHPLKSKSTGEIVPVEEGEAEWLLDVLEELFEYYYVAPAEQEAKRASLNKKLEDLGKPPLKAPPAADVAASQSD
jgi:hypothetical protein